MARRFVSKELSGSCFGLRNRLCVLSHVVLLCFCVGFSSLNFVAAEKEPVDVEETKLIKPNNNDSLKYGDFLHPGSFLNKFPPQNNDFGFIHAFVASVSVIVVSELGDKTFFIAAIMAMRHERVIVFLGALSALAVMTILSACLGFATTIIPRKFTYYVSTALFAIFGLKMLKEGYSMSPNEGQEEYEEVQADLRKREDELEKEKQTMISQDMETGIIRGHIKNRRFLTVVSPIFVQAFTLTFLAEWGDRSQLTTIILAAREDAIGVTLGGILGHAFCTALAVVGGRIIAQRISVRTVTIVGGVVFLIFALSALFMDPGS